MIVALHNRVLALFVALTLTVSLFVPMQSAFAEDESISIDDVSLTVLVDSDENNIANIGDTIRVRVMATNADGRCSEGATAFADLRVYGGEEFEELTCANGEGETEVWTITHEIVDAGADGIDDEANSPESIVRVSLTDDDESATTTGDTNPVEMAVDTVAPEITGISVTGGSGTDGAFIIGDTITVSWDNSEATGDANFDTIDAAHADFLETEYDASDGNEDQIWTTTILVDELDDVEDDELEILFYVVDDAGNTSFVEFEDVHVDNVAPDAPSINPASGTFTDSEEVTVLSESQVRYTTNGAAPTCSTGTLYAGAFEVADTATVKAVACDSAGNASAVASATYTKEGGGSSSGSKSSKSSNKTGATPASPTSQSGVAQTIKDIIEQNRSLLTQAESMGITLPQFIKDILSGGTPTGLSVRDLTIGSTGADVTALQNILMKLGHTIPAGATGYFGPQTQSALAAYQSANGITPSAGYFGSITRAFMKAAGVAGIWW